MHVVDGRQSSSRDAVMSRHFMTARRRTTCTLVVRRAGHQWVATLTYVLLLPPSPISRLIARRLRRHAVFTIQVDKDLIRILHNYRGLYGLYVAYRFEPKRLFSKIW